MDDGSAFTGARCVVLSIGSVAFVLKPKPNRQIAASANNAMVAKHLTV